MSDFLKAYNNHLIDFMEDILNTLNEKDKVDFKSYKIFTETIIKTNSTMIIKLWKLYINDKYIDKIKNNNFDFFLNHDFKEASNKKNVEELINRIKIVVKEMNDENRNKSLKYIKNLCKLCNLYFNNK